MNIFDKIEEIRNEPEHIRLRWVWMLTAGSMAVVVILWFVLLKGQVNNFSKGSSSVNGGYSSEFDEQKKSIKDAVGQIKGTLDNANGATSSAQQNISEEREGFNLVSNSNLLDDSVSSSN